MKVNINNVKYNNFTFNKMKGDLNTPDNPFINTQNKKSNINSNDNLFSLNNINKKNFNDYINQVSFEKESSNIEEKSINKKRNKKKNDT